MPSQYRKNRRGGSRQASGNNIAGNPYSAIAKSINPNPFFPKSRKSRPNPSWVKFGDHWICPPGSTTITSNCRETTDIERQMAVSGSSLPGESREDRMRRLREAKANQ